VTAEQMAARLRAEWPKESSRAIVSGLRRGLYFAAKVAVRELSRTGIGRGILGSYGVSGLDQIARGGRRIKSSQVRMFVKRARVVKVGDQYHTGLEALGFAALVETGGKTAPHTIEARGSTPFLANQGSGFFGGRKVEHRGSRIPRQPFLGRAVTSSQPRVVAEIDKGLAGLGKRLVG
jgi:hypothetical protein